MDSTIRGHFYIILGYGFNQCLVYLYATLRPVDGYLHTERSYFMIVAKIPGIFTNMELMKQAHDGLQ